MPDFSKQLSKYIPAEAAPIISQWINDSTCRFKVTKSRTSKLGDYRAPFRGSPHQITVNHDLNPYAFLMTTVHEFAHLKTYQDFKNKAKPHGEEWKNNFKSLIQPFLKLNIFPTDVVIAINNYMNNPAASSCTDLNLYRVLKKYDNKISEVIHVEELPEKAVFQLKNGRTFQKMDKLRKRYKCLEISTNKIYLFHPIAEVFPVKD
ncbi:SprT family zinc-dependent metalloprotease [Sphingobacterium bovistauri]|uniref:SprT domain-containing protein n=1 Tax=Sphingobacterium bovistauri TaxID=2781959 RepID=A0ABS7Z727_9SPHI|nr:sprT domain-containing protein [Sphingobacterium bovistauri]MCA5005968.1 sprT domain-containing protein [Sphingobacterium bovistauri]